MCELLGVSALYPLRLNLSFQQLMQHTQSANRDGWGAVFYEKNDAYIFREPCPGDSSQLAGWLTNSGLQSRLVLAHTRHATSGSVELRNTHPFSREIQGRLHSFAFNGNIPQVFDLDLTMERYCPIGETDGEFAFCCLLEQLSDWSLDGDWQAVAWRLKRLGAKMAEMGPANFIYTDSMRLYAFASRRFSAGVVSAPGLFYLNRHCRLGEDSLACAGLSPEALDDCEQQLLLVASRPLSDEAWTPMEKNQLLVANGGELHLF